MGFAGSEESTVLFRVGEKSATQHDPGKSSLGYLSATKISVLIWPFSGRKRLQPPARGTSNAEISGHG